MKEKTKRIRKIKRIRKTNKRQLRLKRTQKGGNKLKEQILEDAKQLSRSDFEKKYKITYTDQYKNIYKLLNIYKNTYKLDPKKPPNKESYPEIYKDIEIIEKIITDDDVKTVDYIDNLYFIVSAMKLALEQEIIKIKELATVQDGKILIKRNFFIVGTYRKLINFQLLLSEMEEKKETIEADVSDKPLSIHRRGSVNINKFNNAEQFEMPENFFENEGDEGDEEEEEEEDEYKKVDYVMATPGSHRIGDANYTVGEGGKKTYRKKKKTYKKKKRTFSKL
jgi:hypothetical protein